MTLLVLVSMVLAGGALAGAQPKALVDQRFESTRLVRTDSVGVVWRARDQREQEHKPAGPATASNRDRFDLAHRSADLLAGLAQAPVSADRVREALLALPPPRA